MFCIPLVPCVAMTTVIVQYCTHTSASGLCVVMAYGGMPCVGMALKKNGGHIKSAQMTRSKCLHQISQRPPRAITGIIECFHGQQDR